MFVGFARYEFLVPGSSSLKDKRQVVRRMVDKTQAKFNVAIAEVDYMDLRQRGAVGVSCVSNSSSHVTQMLDEVERFVRSHFDIEILSVDSETVTPDA